MWSCKVHSQKSNHICWIILDFTSYGNWNPQLYVLIYYVCSILFWISSCKIAANCILLIEMGSSYTFFKSLDLSKSNGWKNTLIIANIFIIISLITLIYYILNLSLNKIWDLTLSHSLYVSLSLSLSPPPLLLHHCSTFTGYRQGKKKKNQAEQCFYFCEYSV